MQDVRDLLLEHGYAPVARLVGAGVVLSLPDCPGCPGGMLFGFSLVPEGVLQNSTDAPAEVLVPMPDYARRPYVALAIPSLAGDVGGFPPSTIACLDADGLPCPGMLEALPAPESTDRESAMSGVVAEADLNGFGPRIESAAHRLGVLGGYRAIARAFSN